MDEVRLIDAKALESKLIAEARGIEGKNRFDRGESWGFELAAKMVSNIPSINPEKLRPTAYNDNWKYRGCDEFVCSKCGIHLEDWTKVEVDLDTGDRNCFEYEFKYCPNCGARMEE